MEVSLSLLSFFLDDSPSLVLARLLRLTAFFPDRLGLGLGDLVAARFLDDAFFFGDIVIENQSIKLNEAQIMSQSSFTL